MSEKQDTTLEGARVFERVEKGIKKLTKVVERAYKADMIDLCECHRLQSKAMQAFYAVQELHCDLTHVAKHHGCDVPPPPSDDDDGGVVVTGGGGR